MYKNLVNKAETERINTVVAVQSLASQSEMAARKLERPTFYIHDELLVPPSDIDRGLHAGAPGNGLEIGLLIA
jgi:hypothetical protein